MQLFRGIEMPSDEPVQYVGCYVLRWGDWPLDPEVGFVPVEMDEVYEMIRRRALQWDEKYTNKAYKASPSEYLVWRGRALEAAYLAEVIRDWTDTPKAEGA